VMFLCLLADFGRRNAERERGCYSEIVANWIRLRRSQFRFLLTRTNVECSIYRRFTDSIKFLVFHCLCVPLIT